MSDEKREKRGRERPRDEKVERKLPERSRVDVSPELNKDTSEAVVAFGRMNPPTSAHFRLVERVIAMAEDRGATSTLFLSEKSGDPRNPLDFEDRAAILETAFEGTGLRVLPSHDYVEALSSAARGAGRLTVVVGGDRLDEVRRMVERDSIRSVIGEGVEVSVVSIGDREDDTTSATAMREFAARGDRASFRESFPEDVAEHADDVFRLVSLSLRHHDEMAGLGGVEEIDEGVLNIQQRLKRKQVMRRFRQRIERARKIARKRLARERIIRKRAFKTARAIVRKRVAGKRGANYASLTPADKMQVDRLLLKRVALIRKIAKKILPRVKQAEVKRLQLVRAGSVKGTDGGLGKMPIVSHVEHDEDLVEGLYEADESDIPLVVEAIMNTPHDDRGLNQLLRAGLVDRNELADVKRALMNPEAAAKNPRLREKLFRMLGKLTDAVVGDQTLLQRTKQAVRPK